jgi:hypothetical protein
MVELRRVLRDHHPVTLRDEALGHQLPHAGAAGSVQHEHPDRRLSGHAEPLLHEGCNRLIIWPEVAGRHIGSGEGLQGGALRRREEPGPRGRIVGSEEVVGYPSRTGLE